MIHINKNNISGEKGFTLLELLLVIGLTTTLVIGFGRLSSLWANRELAELSGVHMQKIAEVTESYIRANAAANPPILASGDITAAIVAELPDELKVAGEIINPVQRTAPINIGLQINGDDYEALIYTTGPAIPYSRLLPAARAAGGAGGMITDINPVIDTPNIAKSAFGLWEVNVLPFTGGPLNVDRDDGGQLVSYITFSSEEIFGAYLYRQDMDAAVGRPELNTMFTDLNMNGFALTGAGIVETTNMEVYNTATLNQLAVDGNTTFTGSVDITGNTAVGGTMAVTNDVTVVNGNVEVGAGDINAQTVNVNTAFASEVNAPNVSATNLDVTANTTFASELTITGDVDLLIDGEIQADSLNANTIDAAGTVTTNQMTVENNITVNGDATITGSAVMDVLAVDDCVTIQPGPAPNLNDQYGPNC